MGGNRTEGGVVVEVVKVSFFALTMLVLLLVTGHDQDVAKTVDKKTSKIKVILENFDKK